MRHQAAAAAVTGARHRITLVLILALLAAGAQAKHVYSWKDDKGVLHFSDQNPGSRQTEVKSTRVEVDRREWVSVRDERSGSVTAHYLRNLYGGPIEVQVSLTQSQNTLTDPELPARITVSAFSEARLFTAAAVQPGRYSYQYSYQPIPGAPDAPVDLAHSYALPFRSESPLPVSQGFNGSYSHQDEYSRHAIDIGMPEGTPVLAARAGVVMEIEEDFDGGGSDQSRYGDRANYIRIVHADGSMAVYAHLRLESVRVTVGQTVNAGQQIAESGNTGYSTGPHLHFVIQRNVGMRVVSVPFKLGKPNGLAAEPVEGELLQP